MDSDLFVEDETGHSSAIWGYLDQARQGFHDAKLIACYGHSGVQWPALKCDGTDSLDSYPQTLRQRIIAVTTKLDAAKATKKAKEVAEKVRAEQSLAVTPIQISPGWQNFPHVEHGKPLLPCKGGKKKGEGKVEVDDVPLGN